MLLEGYPIRSICGGHGGCGQCKVQVLDGYSMLLTLSEQNLVSKSDAEAGWRLACQIRPKADMTVHITQSSIPVLHWRLLQDSEYGSLPILPKRPELKHRYGIAVDLGSTHVRLSLWALGDAKRLTGCIGLNPQIAYGGDVLTRLSMAERSESSKLALIRLIRSALANAIEFMLEQTAITASAIDKMVIVGNTAMLALASGKNIALLLQPEFWQCCIDIQPETVEVVQRDLGLSKQMQIDFVPPLGGFIGSDLLMGVINTQLTRQPAYSLLVDFGTNSEIALWDGKKLWVTSAAGGPAFEGCGISCGMSGEAGAIYRVESDKNTGFQLAVIGDVTAQGLCGSGLIDAIAYLLEQGLLDKLGRFTRELANGFVLAETDKAIVLNASDIDVFQRAKASIAACIRRLCDLAGVALADLTQIYASGAFGQWLAIHHAQRVGLLPTIPAERIHLINNTALSGCEEVLLISEKQQYLREITTITEVCNMAEDLEFETLYLENLYLQPMQA
ncbi:ASKHA domain-containing protein [Methylocucumis oryzae]|uniref:ASKHA domain-containing protein n=1 Tax=Methylocucumis oryzae TaxID=1632867 RepID=UPI0006972716|nr:ASKHA domain-containing protein [Methylocucumis oryzae]